MTPPCACRTRKARRRGLIAHTVQVENGRVSVGDTVHAAIDVPRRERIRRNHTATHILHWALRQVLGDHVKQAGSYVADSRLRFDFTHFEAMTAEQIAEVERLANEKIMENHPVRAYETSLASAREAGVMALFGEKYGEFVRVLDIEGFSQELCGGTHVSATSEIGFVKITSETSVGANLRRVEAVTSFDALAYMNRVEAELKETAEELRVPLFDVSERTGANVKQLKDLQTKMKRNRQTIADDGISTLLRKAPRRARRLPGGVRPSARGRRAMRNAWDVLRARLDKPGAGCAGHREGRQAHAARCRHAGRWRRASTPAPSSRRSPEHQGRRRRKGRHGAGRRQVTLASTRRSGCANCCCRGCRDWTRAKGVRCSNSPGSQQTAWAGLFTRWNSASTPFTRVRGLSSPAGCALALRAALPACRGRPFSAASP